MIVLPANAHDDERRVYEGWDGKLIHAYYASDPDMKRSERAARLANMLYSRIRRAFFKGDLGIRGPQYWLSPAPLPLLMPALLVVQWRIPAAAGRDIVLLAGLERLGLAEADAGKIAAVIAEAAKGSLTTESVARDLAQISSNLAGA